MRMGEFESSAVKSPMSEINVTPLVDVMLVLLVIFIITTPLMGGALRLDLPATESSSEPVPTNSLSLSLDPQGLVFIDDKPVALEALPAVLAMQASTDATVEVQLRADQSVPYGRVAEVMGLLQKAGLTKVALAVQAPAPKIKPSPPPLRP
ncbi:MAG: biopolymer transporter ExbD [Betaproteobacteria bacterium]|nr:biopolymer transporter ExbD [Betaproteobacteria bacterium]NBY32565.1 biopolymer transporter ExbD [Betaproteobacteria bacterium]NDF05997.1 biopolymer transporter ExbD [Betaproteobacteria bacterium]